MAGDQQRVEIYKIGDSSKGSFSSLLSTRAPMGPGFSLCFVSFYWFIKMTIKYVFTDTFLALRHYTHAVDYTFRLVNKISSQGIMRPG